MMKSLFKSLSLVFTVISIFLFLLTSGTASGQEFIPPVPDKSKTLPANDGDPAGCNSSRFECVMDGTAVLDKQTGLIWARDAKLLEKTLPWKEAMESIKEAEIGGEKGWRLPTRDELISILDTSQSRPALPEGHPFLNTEDISHGGLVHRDYWTSTEYEEDNEKAWMVSLAVGKVFDSQKWFDYMMWPVRDGE